MPKLLTSLLVISRVPHVSILRRGFYRLLPVACCLFCAPAASVFAQSQPAQAPSAQVTTAVTVLDKHGKFVPNLTKNDFTLTDDGQPEAITSFTQASTGPLTLGILVQTSASQSASLDSQRTASGVFLDHIPPEVRVVDLGGRRLIGGFVPLVGYLEAVTAPLVGGRLRRRASEKYAGLRVLAKD